MNKYYSYKKLLHINYINVITQTMLLKTNKNNNRNELNA